MRQSEGALAIEDAKVDSLCLASHAAVNRIGVDLKHLGSSGRVDVMALDKGVHQSRILAQCGRDAQFDLAVVGGEEHVVVVPGDEGLADGPALFRADGDVLQVGIFGAQSSCCGHRLLVGGVHPTGLCVDQLRQGVYVGGLELLEFAVAQDGRHNGVLAFDFFEDLLSGGVLAGLCFFDAGLDFEGFEQDGTQLLGAVDVEFLPGVVVDFRGQSVNLLPQFLAVPVQFIRIDADPFEFHVGQNLDQGHLHSLEQFIRCDLGQPGPEYLPQLKGDVGVFAGVFCDGFHGQIGHGLLGFAGLPNQIGDGNCGVTEFGFGEAIEFVGGFGLNQVMRYHRVEDLVVESEASNGEHLVVKFEMVGDGLFVGVSKDGLQPFQKLLFRPICTCGGDPKSRLSGHRKRDADQLSGHHIQGGGFGVKRKGVACLQGLDQRIQGFRCRDELVIG